MTDAEMIHLALQGIKLAPHTGADAARASRDNAARRVLRTVRRAWQDARRRALF